MKLASVILDIPTQALDAPYWYALLEPGESLPDSNGQPNQQKQTSHQTMQPSLEDFMTALPSQPSQSAQPSQPSEAASAPEDPTSASADAPFSLRVPHTTEEEATTHEHGTEEDFPAQVGCAVLVPFGNRQVVGFIVDIADHNPNTPLPEGLNLAKLKPIERVLSHPYFTATGARCAQFLAHRYVAPWSACIRLCMPPGGIPKMEHIDGRWQLTKPLIRETDERWVVRLEAANTYTPRKNAAKQKAILEALVQGDLRVSELANEYGSVASTLKSLEAKGLIRIETRRKLRMPDEVSPAFSTRIHTHARLTADQEQALAAITQAQQQANGSVILLDGVTGSGKTEVYLCAIERALAQGQGALVLVPEISLTPQTLARFRGRFGDTVAVLHSRMSQGERYDQWDLIRTGTARVVVGARSALFAPMENIGLIVIDEEHESSYKQDQAPRYVTRDVAAWLAQEQHATLVLGSATPSLEALHQCSVNPQWHHITMPHRANGKPLPTIQIVDMAQEFGGGNRSMFSKALQKALFDTINQGQKAVLLLNQRGFAQFLLCRDCGFVPECTSCSTSLTYHEQGSKLVCHHCGYTSRVPQVCPQCGSPYLKRFGAGTQRVEDELRALLAEKPCTIVRMDADTTARKGAHQRLLEQFASADAAVLLGTQMIAKGLDFDEVTLVGVINADTMLKLPDFRSTERTFDLIEQVAGRSGRADLPGHVLVQTYSASNVAIRAAAAYDRSLFLESELRLREGLGYPPYRRLANVLMWGKNEQQVQAASHALFDTLRHCLPSEEPWLILPPTACVLSRLKGSWRYHILIKAPASADIATYVQSVFRERKPEPGIRVSLDIDPVSIL